MKEEIRARVEATIDANQEQMEARIKANNEKFEARRGTFISQMVIHQASTKAIQEEITAKTDTHQGRMEASMNAWQKETTACHEAKEACLEKT
jgi:hypothetical protein